MERYDADGHVIEPPDTWQNRVPKALKATAPRLVHEDGYDAWVFEDGKRVSPIHGTFSPMGVSPVNWGGSASLSYEKMRPGAYDGKERLRDLDIDFIHGVVLHPTVCLLRGANTFSETDRELQVTCVSAYNDWLAEEYCSADPRRLVGLAVMPTTGVEDALAELKRAADIPNLRGALLGAWPNGTGYIMAEDDRFWAAAQEMGIPIVIHISISGGTASSASPRTPEVGGTEGDVEIPVEVPIQNMLASVNAERTAAGIMYALAQMVATGVLERFPNLTFVGTETGVGWLPYFLEQLDDNFLRHRFWTHIDIKMLPSEYILRQCFFTFQVDTYGIRNREQMLHNIMWSTDYPHSGADWPNSVVTIERNLVGVPQHERDLILRENCIRAYGLNA